MAEILLLQHLRGSTGRFGDSDPFRPEFTSQSTKQMKKVSDFEINTRIRSVFAKNWIDMQRLKFGSCRGVARISGELHPLGDRYNAYLDGSKLEKIVQEIRRIRGVVRVCVDFSNWQKKEDGKWIEVTRRVSSLNVGKTAVLDVGSSSSVAAGTARPKKPDKKSGDKH